jgi:deoxycytidylate deaminase
MATYTITINDRTNKTKHLLGLIKEIAKTENKYIYVEHSPNAETIKAIMDSELGKVTKTRGKKDFFAKLNS